MFISSGRKFPLLAMFLEEGATQTFSLQRPPHCPLSLSQVIQA